MNEVQPIRSLDKIEEIQSILLEQSYRNYLMFTLGINSGLRISDILNLKVKDVLNKSDIKLREKKTGKERTFPLKRDMQNALKVYCKGKDLEEFLIKSRKGKNKSITRQNAYDIIKKAGEKAGVYNLGTHTMRKTFGYHFYRQNKNIAILMQIFNHSSERITIKYIGVMQDEIDKHMGKFKIGRIVEVEDYESHAKSSSY